MKLAIIGGGGLVGSTAAFVIAQQQLFEQISLIDARQNVAKSHEMDMEQAMCGVSNTQIVSGGMEQLTGADVVILSVGQPGQAVESTEDEKRPTRMSLLKNNFKIVEQIAPHIKTHCPEAILINMTNPLDVINSLLPSLTGLDPKKVIGFSLNDTTRFRWALSKCLNVKYESINALVLGEHGELQCPLYSQIYVDDERVELTPDQKNYVSTLLENWFAEHAALNAGRSSGWLSAVNAARLLDILLNEKEDVIPCSVIADDGISLGRAVRLNRNGLAQIVSFDLSDEEKQRFEQAKQKVADAIQSLQMNQKI